MAAVHRSFPQLVHMLGTVDVVHGAYYALIWLAARVGGSGEFALRLPSAVALAVAAAFVTALGGPLASSWAGLASGLVFAVLPSVSWFAETAREGALVAALATVASYCLVRTLQAESGRRGWLIGYAAALAVLGLANLFGLLIVLAHAVTLGCLRQRYRVGRSLMLGWLAAAVAAAVVVSPVAVAGYGQLHQIHWLKPPTLQNVLGVQRIIGSPLLFLLMVVIVLTGVAVSVAARRPRLPQDWPAGLLALALPWLILPPVILLTASLVHPVYTFRYIVFCIPAAALLIGTAVAALGRYAGPVALVVILVAGLHIQAAERLPDGHGLNIRAADHVVARHAEPGDALLNVSGQGGAHKGSGERLLERAYPFGFAQLRDVSAGVSPQRSGTLGGTYASEAVIRQRLAGVRRLWVVEWTAHRPVPVLHGLGFTLARSWNLKGLRLRLFVARGLAVTGSSPGIRRSRRGLQRPFRNGREDLPRTQSSVRCACSAFPRTGMAFPGSASARLVTRVFPEESSCSSPTSGASCAGGCVRRFSSPSAWHWESAW